MTARRVVLAALVALVALLAVNTIVTNRETAPAEAEAGTRVVEAPGGDLNVRERGRKDAPAIVLLHCYTCSMDYWSRLEPLLPRDRRVIAFDLLGHGGSEKPKDGYGIAAQADGIAAALRDMGVEDAIVAGQSLGGHVTTALSQRHPELVAGAVVMDSGAAPGDGELPFMARLALTPVLGPALKRITPDAAIEQGLSRAFADGFEVPDAFVDDVRAMTYPAFSGVPDAVTDYIEESPLDERLTESGKPVLVIFGAEDHVVDPDSADAYADIPGARVEILPDVGHTPQMEAPAKVAALMREFEDEVDARPPAGE
jgi:pimeloyl-ACP methyl ester carboxylesterase